MKRIMLLLLLAGCTDCKTTKEIKSIGGCDKVGYCGVSYTDGTFGTAMFPVIGKSICVERKFWWEE